TRILELLHAGEVVMTRLVREDFRLEVLHDHDGAPRAVFLRSQDVAVDVIADVENLIAAHAERALEVLEVAALVDLAAFEREDCWLYVRAVDLHQGAPLLE